MDARLEEFKRKIESLEEKNKALEEANAAQADDLEKWEPIEQLLWEINGCRRLIDAGKALDEIMKLFREGEQ